MSGDGEKYKLPEIMEAIREDFLEKGGDRLVPVFLGFRSQAWLVFYAGGVVNSAISPIGSVEMCDEGLRAYPLANFERRGAAFFKTFPSLDLAEAFLWLKDEFESEITEYKEQTIEDVAAALGAESGVKGDVLKQILKVADDVVPGVAHSMLKDRREAVKELKKEQVQKKKERQEKAAKAKGEAKIQHSFFKVGEAGKLVQEGDDVLEPMERQLWLAKRIHDFRVWRVSLKSEQNMGREYVKPYRYDGPIYKNAVSTLMKECFPGGGIVVDSPENGNHDVPPEPDAVLAGEIVDEHERTLRQFWVYQRGAGE